MIDCARPGRKKPSVLLASASTHLRLRFPFVSPTSPSFYPANSTGSDSILLPSPPPAHPLILPLASSHPHYVRRRYRLHLSRSNRPLIPPPKTLLRRSRTSCAPQFTFDAVRARPLPRRPSIPSFFLTFFFFFISNLPPASFNLSRFFRSLPFSCKIKFAP